MNAKVWLRCSAVLGLLTAGATAQELIGLRIEGPDEVVENTVTPYRVFAEFDDGREFEVTLFSDLSVDPGEHAQIDQFGDFETFDVPGNQAETIHAEFEFNQKRVQADLEVTIIDVNPAGFALDFDGQNDVVKIRRTPELEPTELTIEAWIKGDSSGPVDRYVFTNDGESGGGFTLAWSTKGDRRISLSILDSQHLIVSVKDADPNAIYVGEWHHVAGVYSKSNNTARLYVDGLLKGAVESIPRQMEYGGNRDIEIGNFTDKDYPFDGKIDEVRLWSVARKPHQIRCDMHRVLRGDEEGLVGYWRFDEARGQVAADSSPYGNDGVLGTSPDPDASDPAWVLSEADLHLPPNDPPVWSEPELVPEVSSGEDWSVSISSDQLTIYVSSERDGFAQSDIYVATRDSVNDPFSKPIVIREVSIPGFENHENHVNISANDLRMYFTRHRGRGPGDLYLAERQTPNDPWNTPLPISSLNTGGNEFAMAIAGDELFSVFTTDRSGEMRFWSASRGSVGEPWSDLRPIDSLEGFIPRSCNLSQDGLTLFVAARSQGKGDADIWKLSRPSREAEFGTPTLVEALSSPKADFNVSLAPEGLTIYLVRQRTNNAGDVYVANLEGGGGCEVDCDAIRKLKVKCRGNKLKVLVKSSLLEGTELTIDNDGDQRVMTIKRKGKGKLTWHDQTGIHTVQIIECPDYVKAVNCGE